MTVKVFTAKKTSTMHLPNSQSSAPQRIKKFLICKTSPTIKILAVNTPTAAEMLGCSESYLRKARSLGKGPNYCKLGDKVVYPIKDLNDYLESNKA